VGGSGGDVLEFHGERQGLLDDLPLEVRLGYDGEMGHGKPLRDRDETSFPFTIRPSQQPCRPEMAGALCSQLGLVRRVAVRIIEE
jgi:hypothetical protein